MASAELCRRVEKVVAYAPLSGMSDVQSRESHKALLDASAFEDLAGRWQAAILKAEQKPADAARRDQRLAPGGPAAGGH